ncbi:chemotaxis protein CheV [Desulfuribacillus stibiiarsenatis]|uniref:Chemotaxis protein CheV n=1 Tax=Desulfuribacillus stibiiarsenatis TaxID=1390249 RepID=A0A1E5L273_9FIRM|nr:chemotaxis protein [Desulfuribacillus stibiiarsenatis]OEH84206.1 chemotaxis protein CheV [Desulfuribacillus stibiiarsenatis]
MNHQKGILLESGTNELEIVEFGIGSGCFGINVMKVREIVTPQKITKLPNSHPNAEGVIHLRGEVIPLVDLAKAMNLSASERPQEDRIIIAEFNMIKVAFHVHTVNRIHRISWEQIEKPSEFADADKSTTTGIIKMGERLIILLDFEKIIVEMSPKTGITVDQVKELGPRVRSNKNILIAEDSTMLRQLLRDTLGEAGFQNLYFYNDGRLAWEYLEDLANKYGDKLTDHIQLVITDIEMPKMDGHHFTRRVKEHNQLKKLPVIIFSSLITDTLRHKGEVVGADAQISKPEITDLVRTIDRLIL